MSKPQPLNCSRCGRDSTPGTEIGGHQSGESYRVYQCEHCGHVELRDITPGEATDNEPEPPAEPEHTD